MALAVYTNDVSIADTTAKKVVRRAQPARTTQSAPDTTGTIAKAPVKPPKAAPIPASAPDVETTLTPFDLPTASRKQMRACGEQWHSRKLTGTTGKDDWRDFAIKCLVVKDATTAP